MTPNHFFIAFSFSLFLTLSDFLITGAFSLIDTVLLFSLVWFATTFFPHYRLFYALMLLFSTLHQLFYTYFRREITPTDIRLFFGHLPETFETFIAMKHLFVLPAILFLGGSFLIMVYGRFPVRTNPIGKMRKIVLSLVLAAAAMHVTTGTRLAGSATETLFSKKPIPSTIDDMPIYPVRESNVTIVLVIGESMKYNGDVEERLRESGHFYKKIYTGATNTDVSVPLLINGKTDPLKLSTNNETNLFRLAKKSGYRTVFWSVQSAKSLRYIEPYLQKGFIDSFKTHDKSSRRPLYDFLLQEALRSCDPSHKAFIVLQQIGQHSPYIYFPGEKSKEAAVNYGRSVAYSFRLYRRLIDILERRKRPYVFVMTSDHGEFTGEGGRYGHNCFDPVVYEVPLMIASNIPLPENCRQIASHHHLYRLLTYLLGYGKRLSFSDETFVVNGTMLTREDGFIEISPLPRVSGKIPNP